MAWTAGAAGVLVMIGALTACGSGGSSDGVASLDGTRESAQQSERASKAKKDPQEAFRAFAQCMREHGIDMPDPQVSDDAKGGNFTVQGPVGGAGGSGPSDEFKKADAACKKHLDGVVRGGDGKGPSDADIAKAQKQALAFAKCMREHGIDFPDPQFDGGRITQIAPGDGLDPNDPTMQSAMKACQKDSGLKGPGQGAVSLGKAS
jgi:hypothetical protein